MSRQSLVNVNCDSGCRPINNFPKCRVAFIEVEGHSSRVRAVETKNCSRRKTTIDDAGNLVNFRIGLSEVQHRAAELNGHGGSITIKLIETEIADS